MCLLRQAKTPASSLALPSSERELVNDRVKTPDGMDSLGYAGVLRYF